MYAVIKTGGKQYKVNVGDVINVEKLAVNVGDEVVFDEVLLQTRMENMSAASPALRAQK